MPEQTQTFLMNSNSSSLVPTAPETLSEASADSPSKTTLQQLPRELLIAIFENLAGTSDVAQMRLISQLFEDLAAPIFYHHVVLTPDLVSHFPLPSLQIHPVDEINHCLHRKMDLNTKIVTIGRNLDGAATLKLLRCLSNLHTIM